MHGRGRDRGARRESAMCRQRLARVLLFGCLLTVLGGGAPLLRPSAVHASQAAPAPGRAAPLSSRNHDGDNGDNGDKCSVVVLKCDVLQQQQECIVPPQIVRVVPVPVVKVVRVVQVVTVEKKVFVPVPVEKKVFVPVPVEKVVKVFVPVPVVVTPTPAVKVFVLPPATLTPVVKVFVPVSPMATPTPMVVPMPGDPGVPMF
jgi:hypothetical protein